MNAMFIETTPSGKRYADIAVGHGDRITTAGLIEGRYVRISDSITDGSYRQLCKGAAYYGDTLIYYTDEQLARDCKARLYKTRAGFNHAVAKLAEDSYA